MKDESSEIWLIYTAIMTLIGSQFVSKSIAENIFISILASQILLAIWIIISIIANSIILECKFRFKISAPKRFKDKVTPIYAIITYHELETYFKVKKYELKWKEFNLETSLFYSVPFASLFLKYKYVEVGEYEFEYEISGITDIALLYEDKYNEIHAKKLEIKTEKDIKTHRINKLNKIFLENYEK